MYGEMEMIRVRSEYDSTVEGLWKLTDKVAFSSSKKSYRRSTYYLSKPQSWNGINNFAPKYTGAKPVTIGTTCLTVWSK